MNEKHPESIERATMQVYSDVGMGELLQKVFDSLKNKPLGSAHFWDWVGHFENNMIGEYLRFVPYPFQNSVDFYCTWKKGKIARIYYFAPVWHQGAQPKEASEGTPCATLRALPGATKASGTR